MDEFKKALADFYEGWELVAFLNISVEDVIAAFPDEIDDNADELKGEMDYGEDE